MLRRLAALSFVALVGCAPPPPQVSIATAADPPEGVTVTGHGKASARPDIARAQVGVESRADAAGPAVAETNATMAKVLGALRRMNVADADLKTSQLSVHRELVPAGPEGGGGRDREVFRATNTVEITIRDLDRVGEVLSAAVQAGANVMHGVTFTVADRDALERRAREAAMRDARARAEQLARLGGLSLGPVEAIRDAGGAAEPPRPYAMAEAMKTDVGTVPVERGELEVEHDVLVRFALGRR